MTKQRVQQLEKEKQLVSKCLKLRLLHAQTCVNNPQGEQYLELPRAIATETGIPNKGNKSLVTTFYRNRYDNVFVNSLPAGWLPEIVILEGMFIIQCHYAFIQN